MIVNSNKTFSAWAGIFGDPIAVAAMVDRLVHQAEVTALKGDSYRLKGRRKEVATSEASWVPRIRPGVDIYLRHRPIMDGWTGFPTSRC